MFWAVIWSLFEKLYMWILLSYTGVTEKNRTQPEIYVQQVIALHIDSWQLSHSSAILEIVGFCCNIFQKELLTRLWTQSIYRSFSSFLLIPRCRLVCDRLVYILVRHQVLVRCSSFVLVLTVVLLFSFLLILPLLIVTAAAMSVQGTDFLSYNSLFSWCLLNNDSLSLRNVLHK